ncbi:MAG TPA: glycosyltransferase [Nocardioidaceae bacterium]|nr:glycosyltransferase [Nocardioidaceae bacterium]
MSAGDPSRGAPDVVAVVVTWNRRDLLAESLAALRAQTLPPARIVVVDNASTDGTADLLEREHADLETVRLSRNTGGAGGFAAGMERALTFEPDLLWLLDDDTVPTPTAAERLVGAWSTYPSGRSGSPGRRPAVLASRVVWTDGRDHPMNTPRARPGATASERAAAERAGCVPIRSASFVSLMCDADVVRERGLPIADYFLWNDDFEYSTRLLRGRVGLYVRDSLVEHRTRTFGSTDADPGERFFFEVRNKVWLFTRSPGLSPTEKVLYAGSTGRRWARTFARSQDRRTLVRGLARGLVVGATTRPRSNGAVLREAGWSPHAGVAEDHPSSREPEPFSLLLAVWRRDDPGFLREAFVSSVHEQTRRPDQVVLVQDGPVPDGLAATLADLVAHSPVPVEHVKLARNVGLGPALDQGLAACAHEIVARMDADDVSLPTRFEKQVPLVEAGADIVGSGLVEFGSSVDDVVGHRTPPTDPDVIRRVIAFRDPFNHPTVVYRRSAVQAAGGYTDMALMEDYLLFARMLDAGARPANLAEPLVCYRVGAGAYARRGGRRLLRSELAVQRRFRQLGITTRRQYVRNVVVRGGYRLVPEALRTRAYRALIANRRGRLR